MKYLTYVPRLTNKLTCCLSPWRTTYVLH